MAMHTSGATDFSAARRHYHHYRGSGQAAAMAAFAGMVGIIGGIAAANARADAYDEGPVYYGPPPAYYGGATYGAPYGGAPASGTYGYGGGTYVDPGGNTIPYQ